jgi:dienelactone hydrolase
MMEPTNGDISRPTARTPVGGRRLLVVVLAVALASPAVGSAASAAAFDVQAGLPRPTGSYAVGRDTLHLVDQDRKDPWVPAAGARQLMVSMYYPAKPKTGRPAPYMTPEEARLLLEAKASGSTAPAEKVSGLRTYARTAASPARGRFPLVVLSPGLTLPRATLSGLAEDLTSHGYVVALVDHTYESSGTTFPDGRTLTCVICDKPPADGPPGIARSRAQDVSFVLDELTGREPAWRRAAMIDAKRIGMAGHSIGGNAAATTMAADKRVLAGVNMDGTLYDRVPAAGLGGRPFLLLGSQSDHAPGKDKTWDRDWPNLGGWKRWLTVSGTEHASFTDAPVLEAALGLPGNKAISAERAEAITRSYVGAFFDVQLKGRKRPLLDGPSPANPEVAFHR